MAEMTIRLRINPETGKKDILIDLHTDSDALPHEHEQQHRNLVDKLIHGGLIKATEVGDVVVERENKEGAPVVPAAQPESERQGITEGA
jgi:hypothetical protein